MVLGAVWAWLLGRAVANRLTKYCKHEVYKKKILGICLQRLVHVILSTWYPNMIIFVHVKIDLKGKNHCISSIIVIWSQYFHIAFMVATGNPSKWSFLVKSYYHSLNNHIMKHHILLVNCTILTNKKRTIYLSIYLSIYLRANNIQQFIEIWCPFWIMQIKFLSHARMS